MIAEDTEKNEQENSPGNKKRGKNKRKNTTLTMSYCRP